MNTQRPRWTLTEAATHVGASRSTLRRRLNTGAFPNAAQDTSGVWRIGIEDLLAAGFTLSKTWVTDPAQPEPEPGSNPVQPNENVLSTERAQLENDLAHERTKNTRLRAELDTEQRLRQAAEQNTNDLRTALRILENKPVPQPRQRWFRTKKLL
jgi:hypothetical protein